MVVTLGWTLLVVAAALRRTVGLRLVYILICSLLNEVIRHTIFVEEKMEKRLFIYGKVRPQYRGFRALSDQNGQQVTYA